MAEVEQDAAAREAVALFKSVSDLQEAIDELFSSGFDRANLCLLASRETVERELGHAYRATSELEDDPDVPRICYVSPESIGDVEGGVIGALVYAGAVIASGAIALSGGSLAVLIIGAALAGGGAGVIGARLAAKIGERYASRFDEQIASGGLLLWVRTIDPAHEERATEILRRHSAVDVHIHLVPD